ncbi:unnamed protein product [Brachionus calyciflorus]|uniref:Uncharacterized protein n=1 Tax=Brachionus calyciflorus TaxID=104777 RepID=A0A814B640_9BILA|nr:unnamed protein product [Brachionus calyciflorus]
MTNSNDTIKFNKIESKKQRKLVLQFDQHNTIQVACTLPGRHITVEEGLNHFLTSAVWGKEVDNEWVWISEAPELNRPPNEPNSMTYFKYLEKRLVGTPSDRAELKKKTCRFVYDEPGTRYKPFFDLYLQSLTYNRIDDSSHDEIDTPNYYNSNRNKLPPNTIPAGDPSNTSLYHLILPEFFDMIRRLQKEKRQFSIILRTMGIDSQNFLDTIRPIMEGKHRDFCDIEPIKINANIGHIKRDKNDQIILQMDGETFETEEKIYEKINSLEGINAIRDDFAYWQENNYECYSAKPLWINLNDQNNHHIIFDDNIRLDSIDDCIVNIRLNNHYSQNEYINLDFGSYNLFKFSSILQPNLIELLNPHLKNDSTKNYYYEMIKTAEKKYEILLQERKKINFLKYELDKKTIKDIELNDSLKAKMKKEDTQKSLKSKLCFIV